MMSDSIYKIIENYLQEKIVEKYAVGGGCIANSRVVETESRKKYFLKSHIDRPNVFRSEANGLTELEKPNCIRIPKVILQHNDFLLIENIEQGNKPYNFFETFGRQLAQLHRYTSTKFGFYEDNYLGSTPQLNIPAGTEKNNWRLFYLNKRLLYQYKLAAHNGYGTDKLRKGFSLLENRIDDILADSEEAPTLIHGDLWGGNYLCDNMGNPVLIDPATYYGHREAELAMTKLFGGFAPDFYHAYNEAFPLLAGYNYRENVYLLYHVMNHLNLFGRSYYNQAVRLLWSYL